MLLPIIALSSISALPIQQLAVLYIIIGASFAVVMISVGVFIRGLFARLAILWLNHEKNHHAVEAKENGKGVPAYQCQCPGLDKEKFQFKKFESFLITIDGREQNEWVYNAIKWEYYKTGSVVMGIIWFPALIFFLIWGVIYFAGNFFFKLNTRL